MRGITTKKLTSETGESRQTLARWLKLGLLPAPETTWASKRRRGRQSVWPAEALGSVRAIRQKLDEGVSLAYVGAALRRDSDRDATDLRAISQADELFTQWRLPGSTTSKGKPSRSVVSVTTEVLAEHLARILGGPRERCERLAALATMDDPFRSALTQRFRGTPPFFVFELTSDIADVIPDFLLPNVFMGDSFFSIRHGRTVEFSNVLVVPVEPILRQVRERIGLELPHQPRRLQTTGEVDEVDETGRWRYEYQVAMDRRWPFDLAYERAKRVKELNLPAEPVAAKPAQRRRPKQPHRANKARGRRGKR